MSESIKKIQALKEKIEAMSSAEFLEVFEKHASLETAHMYTKLEKMIIEDPKESNKLEKILQGLPDGTAVQFFSNNKYVGIEIQVSRPGWGFGAITLSHNLQDGTWHLDDKCTSKERVIQFIRDAAPHIVEQLYNKGNIKIEYKEDEYE